MNPSRKRSVVVENRKTSVSLEDEFWNGLVMMASAKRSSVRECIGRINTERASPNLSSSIRVAILDYYQRLAMSPTERAPLAPRPPERVHAMRE
jgi:predicted DNA-binding ribbon-helix-helix protein